nr:hypothetical protein [Tanacetum cinerariifolium]
NINKLFQPWRSFGAVINKCLTRKSFGFDSFRLSQAQLLWGLYHSRNIDYAFLIWEDIVYQIEHKKQKKGIEMDHNIFSTIKVVSRHQNTQQYEVILPIELTNEDIRNTTAYKEYYACATGVASPKPKASVKKKRGDLDTSLTPPIATPTPITTAASVPRLSAATKGKQPAKAKSSSDLSKAARTEAEQLKIILRRSRQETHISQHGGSSTDEGTDVDAQDEGDKNDESDDGSDDGNDDDNDETVKYGSKRDEDDDDNDEEEEIAKIDEPEDTKSGGDDEEVTKNDREDEEEETRQEEEESFDPIPRKPEESEDDVNDEEDQGLRLSDDERIHEEEEAEDLYLDGRGLQVSENIEDSHVTLTLVHPDGLQESSSVSSFVTSMLNPISDTGVESIFTTASSPIVSLQTPTPMMTPSIIATITTSIDAPIPPTPSPSDVLQNLPTFNSMFRFDERLKSLETTFSEYRQTNPFVDAVFVIPENDEFLRTIDENMKKIIKGQVKSQVKEQVSRILPRIEEYVNATLETEVLTRSSHSSRTSYAVAADLTEMELKKILIEKMEGNKSIQRSDEQRNLYKALIDAYEADKTILESYGESAILKRRREDDDDQEGPSAGSDRGSKRQREGREHASASTPSEQATGSAGSELARQTDARSSFNELLDTPIDISNFIMNRLNIDTLTPKLLDGPTFELMKGSCNSLTELEYHLEEVYKATTDQLDWVNPEDKGGRLRDIKWIEDMVPRTMWIQEPLNYDKYALWGVSHWGRKRQQFYGYVVNRESALDVYSKRRIIVVTELKIMEWHNYKHLDWISVRRDDDKIYKFKEGDFKRLRLQDIEDMLLLLVQGKLSNVTVEERFAFNVSLKMFTRSIVIQRRVEDLQLGVESYQKRLNLTKPDTYQSDLNDRTLNDVCNALDDRLKGIRMQYLPHTIWRRGDKNRAAAMIQAIDKMLKTRRIMRSLEKFVGGRLYEGDFRMLQRTI